ncbi:hypothetical protein [Thalassotalea ganghwensis]
MKIINLVIGAVFIWIGGEKVASESPAVLGWVLLVIGVVTLLSAFASTTGKGSHSSADGGSSWGSSSGGDCGGDSGGCGGGGGD